MSFDTPCEVVGVNEAPDNTLVPFIVVRMRDADCKEKFLMQAGEGVTWEVTIVFYTL